MEIPCLNYNRKNIEGRDALMGITDSIEKDQCVEFVFTPQRRQDIPAMVAMLSNAGCQFFTLSLRRGLFSWSKVEIENLQSIDWLQTPVQPPPTIENIRFRLIHKGQDGFELDEAIEIQDESLISAVRQSLTLPIAWVDSLWTASEFRQMVLVNFQNFPSDRPHLRLVGYDGKATFVLSYITGHERRCCIVDFEDPSTKQFMSPTVKIQDLPRHTRVLMY